MTLLELSIHARRFTLYARSVYENSLSKYNTLLASRHQAMLKDITSVINGEILATDIGFPLAGYSKTFIENGYMLFLASLSDIN